MILRLVYKIIFRERNVMIPKYKHQIFLTSVEPQLTRTCNKLNRFRIPLKTFTKTYDTIDNVKIPKFEPL